MNQAADRVQRHFGGRSSSLLAAAPRRRTRRETVQATRRRMKPWLEREMAGEYDTERLYTGVGEDPHCSPILRTRSRPNQRLGELYYAMEDEDCFIGAQYERLEDAVLGVPRPLVAGDSSVEAIGARDLVRYNLREIPDWSTRVQDLLGAIGDGISIVELMWEEVRRGEHAGAWIVGRAKWQPMWRFAFKKGVLHIRKRGQLVPAPLGKFICHTRGSSPEGWPGWGQKESLYWPSFKKRHGEYFWSLFMEKWASPTAQVTYRRIQGDSDEIEKQNDRLEAEAVDLAARIQSDIGVAVPLDEIKLDLIEASRGGNFSYRDYNQYQDQTIARRISGEISTSGLRPGTGAFASDLVAQDIRVEKVNRQWDDVTKAFEDTLFRWEAELNWGAVRPPRHKERVRSADREELRAGVDAALAARDPQTGRLVRAIPQSHLATAWSIPDPEPGEEVIDHWPVEATS